MPLYEFKAYDADGKKITGVIDAASSDLAYEKIKKKKYYPIKLAEAVLGRRGLFFLKKETLVFSLSQLADLLKAGLPLAAALESLCLHLDDERLRRSFARLKVRIEEGENFSSALAEDKLFPPLLVKLVAAGESVGMLEEALKKFSEFLEKEIEFQKKVISSLIYPAVVVTASASLVLFLITYIAPVLVEIFEKLKRGLPLSTKVLLFFGSFIRGKFIFIAAVIIIAVFLYVRFVPSKTKDKFKLNLPFFGWISKHMLLSSWAKTLGMLHSGGVSILTALGSSREIINNEIAKESFRAVSEKVEAGQTLSSALRDDKFFPPLLAQMVETGEKTGQLSKLLESISSFYEKEISRKLAVFIQLLEPLVIIVLGFTVAFIVISILLPIFEINKIIK